MKTEKVFDPYMILLIIFFISNIFYATGQKDSMHYSTGKSLFQTLCSSCHGVHKEIIGPMLASIVKKKKEEWLIRFIKNSQDVIISGDTYAIFMYKKYNHQVMPSFKQISNEEIKDILFYIEIESHHSTEGINNEIDIPEQKGAIILKGKQLFQSQCSSCHFIDQESYYAPALGSITKRHPRTWLVPFILNSQKVIQSGDPYALDLFHSFKNHVMVRMDFLSENNIHSILDYIEFTSASDNAIAGVNGRRTGERSKYVYSELSEKKTIETKKSNFIFECIFILIGLIIITIQLYNAIRLFNYLKKETPASN